MHLPSALPVALEDRAMRVITCHGPACATAASSMVFVREVCLNVMWPPKVQEALITLHSPNRLEAGLLDGQRHVAAAHHAGVPRGRDFDGLRRSRER